MRSPCPSCGHGWSWQLADGRKKCRSCGARYTPERTIWDAYRIPEKEKRKLVEYFVLGVPVYRSRFRIGCSRRTAERFMRDIRRLLTRVEEGQEVFSGDLEIDESAFGGRRKGKRGWGAVGKVLVLGIYKRNGRVKVTMVANRRHKTIIPLVEAHTTPGSLYFTDDYQAYGVLALRGDHVVVRKEKGRPKGRDHVNGIEGFWSYAKHWLYQYRGVNKKFFPIYLGEISYRYNHRDRDLMPEIIGLLQRAPRTKD